jgi:hypothetical protein
VDGLPHVLRSSKSIPVFPESIRSLSSFSRAEHMVALRSQGMWPKSQKCQKPSGPVVSSTYSGLAAWGEDCVRTVGEMEAPPSRKIKAGEKSLSSLLNS